jgi:hypothetical protein
MGCCKASVYDNWCVGVEIVHTDAEGREYCLFHAPVGCKGEQTKETFNARVFERIDRAKSEGKACDLSGTVFEWDISFRQYNADNPLPAILFNRATFSGDAVFNRATFSGDAGFKSATFSGDAVFNRATFSGDAGFKSATFSGDAGFYSATFSGNAWFKSATFSGYAEFYGATFSGYAGFERATFSGYAEFYSATFSGEAGFYGATFSGYAGFNSATFSGDAGFNSATFSGYAGFESATFKKRILFGKTIFENGANFHQAEVKDGRFVDVDFRKKANLGYLHVERALWFENMGMENVSFMFVDLERLHFSNVRWIPYGGRNGIYDESEAWKTAADMTAGGLRILQLKLMPTKEMKEKLAPVRAIYNKFKLKHKNESNEAEASAWHYSEKEMRWGITGLLPNPLEFLFLWLYRVSSRYAEAPLRAFIVLMLLLFGLSMGLDAAGMEPLEGHETKTGLWYVMVSTFKYATFQKDYYHLPANIWGEILRLATQVLIPLQTALFALAVRNRFRR